MTKYFCLAMFLVCVSAIGQTASPDGNVRARWQKDFLPIFEQQDYEALRQRIYNPEAKNLQELDRSLKENLDGGLQDVIVQDTRLNEHENLGGTVKDVRIDSSTKERRLQRFPLRIVADLVVVPSNSLPDPGGVFVFHLGLFDKKPVIVLPEFIDPDEEYLTELRAWTLSDGSTFQARLVRILDTEDVIVYLKNNFDIFEVPFEKLSRADREAVDALTKRN